MELNKTSSSAQTVASNDDLLIQIFLSIPLKQLVHLKLVSKHWNFIISDQYFNFLRNQNPNPAIGLIFIVSWACHPSSYVVSFDKATNDPDLFREIKLNSRWPCQTLNSCNGLLLCRRKEGNGIDEPKQLKYYVCNPTTNKYCMLPKLDKPYFFYRMCLAFDPSKSPHYRVVCVRKMSSNRNQLEVYSSETSCWRKHGEPFSAGADFYRGVYWNGAIHWIGKTNTDKSLYFNPDIDQVPQVMPTPPMITPRKPNDTYCNYRYFGESCGHLHYIGDDEELNVYEMRTDYSEWFLKYRVDCSLIDNHLDSITCALVRGKKDEDSFLVLQSGERIIRYNLVNKTCETILEKLGMDERIIRYNLVNKNCETILEKLNAAGARLYHNELHPLQYIQSLSHV